MMVKEQCITVQGKGTGGAGRVVARRVRRQGPFKGQRAREGKRGRRGEGRARGMRRLLTRPARAMARAVSVPRLRPIAPPRASSGAALPHPGKCVRASHHE